VHKVYYSIFVEVDEKIQFERLIGRHIKSGKSKEEAIIKVNHTDLPNSELISKSQDRVDYTFRPDYNF